jgi:hypothetical protein
MRGRAPFKWHWSFALAENNPASIPGNNFRLIGTLGLGVYLGDLQTVLRSSPEAVPLLPLAHWRWRKAIHQE